LTGVLRSVRLVSTLFCRSELTAPWGLSVPERTEATFHAVRSGRCWLRVEGREEQLRLDAGDLAVLAPARPHVVTDQPNRCTSDIFDLLGRHRPNHDGGPIFHGGGGSATTLLCGGFRIEGSDGAPRPQLLKSFPQIMLMRSDGGSAASWLEAMLEILAPGSSAPRSGGEAVFARAADLLFVEAIRAHLATDGSAAPGWLRGLSDTRIATALAALCVQPSRHWTVISLAEVSGMSRSSFCERFRALVGEAPSQHLMRWRLHLAARALREGADGVGEIAARFGFANEAAFADAFRRGLGVSPSAYRRRALPAGEAQSTGLASGGPK
jgi:AraC-like DNA-binding protein